MTEQELWRRLDELLEDRVPAARGIAQLREDLAADATERGRQAYALLASDPVDLVELQQLRSQLGGATERTARIPTDKLQALLVDPHQTETMEIDQARLGHLLAESDPEDAPVIDVAADDDER